MAAAIITVHTEQADTAAALAHCAGAGDFAQAEFVLLLHGPNHTGTALEQALDAVAPCPVYGCSSSGEIHPGGYSLDSLNCISFGREHFTCVARHIDGLGEFGFRQASQLVPDMKAELQQRAPGANAATTFALLLIDGLSCAEEFVAAALGSELGNIQLVGGSAGDNWQLERSPVLYKGRQQDDSAVLLLVHSTLPFRHYNFHNFVPTDRRGVITAATAAERLVHEINGAPAAGEFARLCGLGSDEVDREHLALHPAIVTVGDHGYPRGFSEVLPDGSLRSACAIGEGVVFRVAAQVDYVRQMQQALGGIREELGESLLVLALECAARRQMVEQRDMEAPVSALFSEFNVWGLSCMGEQSNSLNMNNSFNCLAFALPP